MQGFNYTSDEARRREFRMAENYFGQNPTEVKLSRKLGKRWFQPNPRENSYIKTDDGRIFALAHLGSHKGDTTIGRGGYGRVKYAMGRDGQYYALKISEKAPKDSEILKTLGMLHGTRERKLDGNKSKHYQVLTYLGTDLSKYYNEKQISPSDRINHARKLAWEVHKLHSGLADVKESIKYVHCDVKPENCVIDSNGRIRLIDMGFAEEICDKGITLFKGTNPYLPSMDNELRILKNTSAYGNGLVRNSQRSIFKRMKQLGQVGCDTFALKRTISYLLNQVPPVIVTASVKELLLTPVSDDPNACMLETPLDIAFAFIQWQMQCLQPPVILSDSADKEAICTCFGILDELCELPGVDDFLSLDEINDYQIKIVSCKDSNDYVGMQLQLKLALVIAQCDTNLRLMDEHDTTELFSYYEKKLTSLSTQKDLAKLTELYQTLIAHHNCLNLLKEIAKKAIGDVKDTKMQEFIESINQQINDPNFDKHTIENKLKACLSCVESDEMRAVEQEMNRLFRDSKKVTTWDKEGMKKKAEAIKTALQAVPIEQRLHVFTYKAPECLAVRKALAKNRLWNIGQEVKNDIIDPDKAANAFTRIKAIYSDMKEVPAASEGNTMTKS